MYFSPELKLILGSKDFPVENWGTKSCPTIFSELRDRTPNGASLPYIMMIF